MFNAMRLRRPDDFESHLARPTKLRCCAQCKSSFGPGQDVLFAMDCAFCSNSCRARFLSALRTDAASATSSASSTSSER